MPGSDFPIIEQISQDLLESIAQINPANGYAYKLLPERFKRLGNPPSHLKAVLLEDNPTLLENRGNQFHEWQQPYLVIIYVIDSEDSPTPIMQLLNRAIADIHRILMVDVNRGCKAINTELAAPTYSNMEDGISAAIVNFTVTYRTLYNDPYSRG